MEKKLSFFLLMTISVLVLFNMSIQSNFLYPIETIDDDYLFLMHQTSLDNLELWVWNRHTKNAYKELTSLYIPAHVQILPSKQAYSFLDRGRIRIKSFHKRTPKTVDIFQPICDIQFLHWITDDQCYFVAQYREHYTIFMYDLTHQGGCLYNVTHLNENAHYLCPNKVDNQLFCVKQTDDGRCSLVSLNWLPVLYETGKQHENNASTKVVELITADQPLWFLTMKNQNYGFVLKLLDKNIQKNIYTFGCCIVEKDAYCWKINQLFELMLPGHLMLGSEENRLYESIYPLLPKYYNNEIYFTSYDQSSKSSLVYKYNMTDKSTTLLPLPVHKHLFAPLVVGNILYAGCCYDNNEFQSVININEVSGFNYCNLPALNQKASNFEN